MSDQPHNRKNVRYYTELVSMRCPHCQNPVPSPGGGWLWIKSEFRIPFIGDVDCGNCGESIRINLISKVDFE